MILRSTPARRICQASMACFFIALPIASCASQQDGEAASSTASGGTMLGSGGVVGSISTGKGGTGLTSATTDFVACTGQSFEQEMVGGPLDIYFIFDRTASMGNDCAYRSGSTPPVDSKACFATYALSDYLINVHPEADTRLAFQFMSLADNDCNGNPYATPLVDLRPLPVGANDALIQRISDETFEGGFGTHIEGALRGMATYTAGHRTEGREMIGVLMTDGDPNGCQENVSTLAGLVASHLASTGIRTFIIGMEGATNANLERLAAAGGAEAHADWCGGGTSPCHYWNVGNGSGDAIASALSAIIQQATPMPCEIAASGFVPPSGEAIDWSKVNLNLTSVDRTVTTIGQVPAVGQCPTAAPAWYYDNPQAPKSIRLCPTACELVTNAPTGATVNVVVGCQETVTVGPFL